MVDNGWSYSELLIVVKNGGLLFIMVTWWWWWWMQLRLYSLQIHFISFNPWFLHILPSTKKSRKIPVSNSKFCVHLFEGCQVKPGHTQVSIAVIHRHADGPCSYSCQVALALPMLLSWTGCYVCLPMLPGTTWWLHNANNVISCYQHHLTNP